MAPDEEVNHESNSDPENSLEFRQIFLFFIKYITDRNDIIILLFRNKNKQKAHETRSVFCLHPLFHQYHLLQRQDTGAGNQLYHFLLN